MKISAGENEKKCFSRNRNQQILHAGEISKKNTDSGSQQNVFAVIYFVLFRVEWGVTEKQKG